MTKTRKKTIWQALFLILLIAGTVYAIRSGKARAPYQRNEGYVFGTFYHITYQHNSDLQNEIEAELQKVDASLSPFNQTSVITRINNNEAVVPDSMFLQVFNLAKEISTNTDGAYDPSDQNFNCNGLISPDRNPNPHMGEVRYYYQSVWTTPVDLNKGAG